MPYLNWLAAVVFLGCYPVSIAIAETKLEDLFPSTLSDESGSNTPIALKIDGCQLEIKRGGRLSYTVTYVDIREFATDPSFVQTQTIKSYGAVFSQKFSVVWYLKNSETNKKFHELDLNQLNGRLSDFRHYKRSREKLLEQSNRINKQFSELEKGKYGKEVQRNYFASYKLGGKIFEKIRHDSDKLEPLLMYVSPANVISLTVRKEDEAKELVTAMHHHSKICD